MDETFRLVFVWDGQTPSAMAYTGPDALTFERLHDAVKIGQEQAAEEGRMPFISYKYMVLDPLLIDVLYKQFVESAVTA